MRIRVRNFLILGAALLYQLPTASAQNSLGFKQSSSSNLFSGESLASFFSSPEFKLIIALIAGLIALAWIMYLFGTYRMTMEQSGKRNRFPLPTDFIPRVSTGTHFFGPAVPQMAPAREEKVQETEERPENDPRGRGRRG